MESSQNNPGQLDVNLQVLGRKEVDDLVTAIGTLTENVNAAHSFASDLRLQSEQAQLRGHERERPMYRPPSVTPLQEQERLNSNQRAAHSSGKDTVSEAGVILPSGVRSEQASTPDAAPVPPEATPTEELVKSRGRVAAFTEKWSTRSLNALQPNEYDDALARARLSQQDQGPETRDVDGPPRGPSAGASSGGGQPPAFGTNGAPGINDPSWKHSLYGQAMAPAVQIPRLGEMTTQDHLTMVSTSMSRFAESRHRKAVAELGESPSDEALQGVRQGTMSGHASAWMGQAAQYSPYIHQIGTRVLGMGAAPGAFGIQMNPNQLLDEQARRGYSTEGAAVSDIPLVGEPIRDLTGLDFNLPAPVRLLATDAGRRGVEREMERTKERARTPGLTGQDQQAIESSLTSAGLASDAGEGEPGEYEQELRSGIKRVLGGDEAQRSGLSSLDPEGAMDSLIRATQHGGQDVDEFIDVMQGIPSAAKAARISMEEMREGMVAMGEEFEKIGGTNAQGQKFAASFTGALGMPPTTALAMLNNPLVAGTIAQQNNVLPQQIGGLAPSAVIKSMNSSVNRVRDTFKGVNPQIPDLELGGEKFKASKRDKDQMRDALAAEKLGMNVQQYQRYVRNMKGSQRRADAEQATYKYAESEADANSSRLGSPEARKRVAGRGVKGDQYMSAGEMEGMLKRAGFKQPKIKDIMKGKTAAEDAKRARTAIHEKTQKKNAGGAKKSTVRLELTPEAEKWLREVRKDKREENANDARAGKKMAAEVFSRHGAPANKRERRKVEQWASKFYDDDPGHGGINAPDYQSSDEAKGDEGVLGKVGGFVEDMGEFYQGDSD